MKTLKLVDGALEIGAAEHGPEIEFDAWREAGFATPAARALSIGNDVDLAGLFDDSLSPARDLLKSFDAIFLSIPYFKDGRAYSQARRLRDDFGFDGALCARGDIGADQIFFLARVGVDQFEVPTEDIETFRAALCAYSEFYQTASDGAAPVWRKRSARAIAA